MGIYLSDRELEVIDRLEPVLVKTYVFLRTRMDRRTGLVGMVTGISYQAIAEHGEYEIRKGQGSQTIRLADTPKARKEVARRLVERLEASGLLKSRGGPVLCFLCVMADYGLVRPNQTGHHRATPLRTDRAMPPRGENPYDSTPWAWVPDDGATPDDGAESGNGPHIRDQGFNPPQSSSTGDNEVAPGGAAAAGVNRDRPPASRASPACGRSGKTYAKANRDRPSASHVGPFGADLDEIDRDRPPASHAAPLRRLGSLSAPGGATPADCGDGEPVGSAENESTVAAGEASPESLESALRAVLAFAAIRVPARSTLPAEMAAAGVSIHELRAAIEISIEERKKQGSWQPVPVKYVAQVVKSERAAARRGVERVRGRRDAARGLADFLALARKLRIDAPRPGESEEQFRNRVRAADEEDSE